MKKILFILFVCLLNQTLMAQAPKWVDKAKRAVFSIITYDGDDKLLNSGNGFFVTDNGIALSDYSTFKGAQRAVIINSDGKQMAVESILGANEMYDVIKFRVAITEKKVPNLNIATVSPAVGAEVYLLPYSTQKDRNITTGKVKEISKIGESYDYYTLSMQLKDKMVSCPVVSVNGDVFGIAQKATGRDTTEICYAASASFAMDQNISGLSINDRALNSIGIKKGLPDSEEQALVLLYVASTQMSNAEYLSLLNDFINQYPSNSEGYTRRAIASMVDLNDAAAYSRAAADFEQALKVADKKSDVYYTIAKQIYSYQLEKPENTFNGWTYDKALEYNNNALAIEALPIYMQLNGDIYFAKNEYDKALEWYNKVNETNLASPGSFYNAAKTKELMGADANEVIALLDSCIALAQPMTADNAAYLLERAQMKIETQQYRQALMDYDAYFDAVNGQVNDVFYYYREQAAFHGRQYQRALDDINKAIELNKNEIAYYVELAVINLRVGRIDEAISELDKVFKMDPSYSEAYRLLGICQIQQKKMAEACASFQKAKELGDTNVDELIEKHCK